MKTNSSRQQGQGSVLLVTLVITGILGLALASYLTLIGVQTRSVARSQVWNSSIPISEAGVEEAIVHLNKNCLWNPITDSTVQWDADSWQPVSGGVQMTRYLGEDHYVVTIVTNAPYSTNAPGIFSKGFVPASFAQNVSSALFATIGVTAGGDAQSTQEVGRQVKVTTGKDGLITRAMVAKHSIDLKGQNIQTDSFDSEDPAYSTGGLYDTNKTKANGDVAVNKDVTDTSLSIGNANIYGSVAVGPGGTISIGPNGKVGDAAWMADASKTGIQPGHSRDDMNVSFPDVILPSTSWGNGASFNNLTVTSAVVTASNTVFTSTGYPTNSGTVSTNTTAQTTTSYPSSGTYIGSVITNVSPTVTSTYPTAGTYVGTVATNTTSKTTSAYPTAGTYIGSVITNAPITTTVSYPSNPYGGVTTNYNGNSGNIKSYTYHTITGYTYEQISGYGYDKITGYTVAHITGYNLVQSIYYTNYISETYDYVFDDGDFTCSTLSGKVLIRGNARIYVTDDVNMAGSTDKIQIGSGASLKLYMGGSSFSIAGNGIMNTTGNADNFWYFGLPSNTDLNFKGNAAFTGVVYAPEADFHLGGGGSDTWDFIGATVTRTVQMNGKFRFHYDESLARKGPSRGYIIRGWNEISLSENP